mmetsp:Transcript_13709/g.43302  ORF Transcript_13709/g.43302 Transcript_13709/m.43302 type:complete len:517 (+) Transcript_13709:80-1630(+)
MEGEEEMTTPPREWQNELERVVLEEGKKNGEDSAASRRVLSHGTPDVSGPAAVALTASNEVPRQRNYGPQRVPRVRKMFRLHTKKPSRRLKPPKGKVIDGRHEQYAITYSMQLGIQRSVEYAATALPDSFRAACEEEITTEFPPEGSDLTPEHAMKHSFAVKDYAPCVFAKIRQLMGVTPELYLESLCSGLSFIDFIANSRSRQFFFYSFDGVFMIKTLRPDEKQFLLKLLPHYYKHLAERRSTNSVFPQNNASLLTRFYGLHCTRLKHLRRKVHFVVMSSIFGANTSSSKEQYDLKGSTFGRQANADVDIVLKDNDARHNRLRLRVGKDRAEALLASLDADTRFLAAHGVMDYSLLVGIYRPDRPPQRELSTSSGGAVSVEAAQLSEFNSRHFTRLPSSLNVAPPLDDNSPKISSHPSQQQPQTTTTRRRPSDDFSALPRRPADPFDLAIDGRAPDGAVELYYLGIIDILQVYNLRKRAETTANFVGPKSYKDCSCVSPKLYRDRFLHFLATIFQ